MKYFIPAEVELDARSEGKSAASITIMAALTTAASFAFVTVADAAPPPKKPTTVQHTVSKPPPPPRTVTRSSTVSHPTTTTRTTNTPHITNTNTPHITNAPHITNTPFQNTVTPNNPGNTPRVDRRTLPQGPRGPTQAGLSPTGLKLGPHGPLATPARLPGGPNALAGAKPKFPVVTVNNKYFPINKGQKYMYVGGFKKFFVPLGVLGVVLIGGSYWYPDGYVSIAGPACTGYTPDGCELHWREVDFADGGDAPQCVQYCPQVGPPPAQIATLPPPPPIPQGACQMTIFSDPNFGGSSAPTGDNQPSLAESGWQNAVSSIQVQAGTWDFFPEDNFGGNPIRLTAGPYPMLAPDWDKKINSFMCVQPGPGA
jgi:hypothetical protein